MNIEQIELRAKDGKADPQETLALIDEIRETEKDCADLKGELVRIRELIRLLVNEAADNEA